MAKEIRMYHGSDRRFTDACDRAGVKPTYRQWRKYSRGFGAAFKAAKGGAA